ncbi:MAG: TlpA disulfide reductase family protein [Arcobacteraceae bacterium]|jgi:thiol-disulfide isomerase/thioredoxin|nr:TlpA disulfide reductase family protein [Arcobacteraceae bacterium]
MKIKKLLFFALLSLSLITGCDKKEEIGSDAIAQPIAKDITLNLKTTTGDDLTVERKKGIWSFEQYPNKTVLVVFFATWCPPCKAEIPHLINLQAKYGKDFQVISVLAEQNKPNEELANFIAEYKISYPVTNSDENFKFADAVGGVDGIPAMFLFDKKGAIVMQYEGATQEEILDSDISKHIGK